MTAVLRKGIGRLLTVLGVRSTEWRFRVMPFEPLRMQKDDWERQYRSGHWNRLSKLSETAHYSVIVGYCRFFKPGGSVLDVGAGEGLLQERLLPLGYSRYVGVDLSAEAIRRAAERQDGNTSFVCADAATYIPPQRFGVIVFNEALYYFDDPLEVVRRYQEYLEDEGLIVVSMHVTDRTKRLWKSLDGRLPVVDSVVLTNGSGDSWVVKAIQPMTSATAGPAGDRK